MIKDKITPELKKRFLDDLRISKEVGHEKGFIMCIDEVIINYMKNNIRTLHEKESVKDVTINSQTGNDLLQALLSKHVNYAHVNSNQL